MSDSVKGQWHRQKDEIKWGNSPFWKRPAHVCKKCRCAIKKGEIHYCPAEGWYEVGLNHWRCGYVGRNHDSRDFLAKQHGCAPHQSDEFNKRYGAYGHWDKKGEPTFKDAHSLMLFRRDGFKYPVW